MNPEKNLAIAWNFLDNLSEGIITMEENGHILYTNPSAKQLLGLQEDVFSISELCQIIGLTYSPALLQSNTNTYLSIGHTILNWQTKVVSVAETKFQQIFILPAPNNALAITQITALTQISSEPDFDKKLQLIVEGLKQSGWNQVALTLRDNNFKVTKLITSGFDESEKAKLAKSLIPTEIWHGYFNDPGFEAFRKGFCYFVPGDSEWSQRNFKHTMASLPDAEAWHAMDVLCVPLYDQQKNRIGLMGLDVPQNGRRPDNATLQTIELYAQFAASIIESAKLVEETLNRTRELELLFEASNAISSTLDKESLLHIMGHQMLKAIHGHGYTIYQWQEMAKELIVLESIAVDPQSKGLETGTRFHQNQLTAVTKVLITLFPELSQFTEANHSATTPPWLQNKTDYTSIILPIIVSEEAYGAIEIFRYGTQSVSEKEIQLLSALGNQASTALETAIIFEDTYQRERFYTALSSVSLAINFTVDLPTVLNLICRESQRIFDVDGAYIWENRGNHLVGSAAKGDGEAEFVGSILPFEDHTVFANLVAQNREAMFINHAQAAGNIPLRIPQSELVQAVLGVPLEQEDNLLGILILAEKTRPDRFADRDISQASLFGVQAAIALQNAKLFEELRHFNEELDLRVAERTQALNEESTRVKILLRITSELSASLDQDRVLNQALLLVNEVVNATQGVILLIDQDNGEMVFRASFGLERPLPAGGANSGLMRDEGLAGWIIDHRNSVIVHDTYTDKRWVQRETSRAHRSAIGVPLISNEDVIGVLMLFHHRPNAFTPQQLDLVEAAAIQVSNAINNANLYLLIRDQAEKLGALLQEEQVEAAKNQAILESIADGVLVADANSVVSLANMATSRILEIPKNDLVGKSVSELLGLYGYSGDSWIATIGDWAKNTDHIQQWTVLADRLTIEEKVVSVHLSPVFVNNQFFGTVSIFRDITKEVEVDKLKSEFVSTVSHELRTPMTSIKGYADLMLMGAAGHMTDPQSRYLQVIKSNADRLHMLVNDLLDISRIETGKTRLDLRPIDVPQIVEQIIEGHLNGRIQHENKQIHISSNLSPSLPLVNADQAGLTQILTNLVDNAFNYTPEGGQITINAEPKGRYVYISVSDSGIGISKENISKIFDRFFRGDDEIVQKVRGTGLGLAIVRSFIEMHGGTLTVDSELGKGSTFTFNIPIVAEDGEMTTTGYNSTVKGN